MYGEEFEDKVVLVTGSQQGLGESTVLLFASLGSKIVITDLVKDEIEKVALKCQSVSPKKYKPLTVVCDLTSEDEIKKLVKETIDTFGRLDVLVNNAGYYTEGNVLQPEVLKIWDNHCLVNVRAIMNLCHLFLPYLVETKGCIITVTNIPVAFYPEYYVCATTSRAAADMFTKNMAAQFASKGVRVNTVHVGGIDTPGFGRMAHAEEKRKVLLEITPLRRLAQPKEIAKAIWFLASSGASFMTGISLTVDGGAILL
ncbi:3-oxoacyl-[acyl-carrier-protein] reductase FabG-like isoform X2 [Leptotrombidium deliense]|uniref:3-oxoacyl-[acyl-carrier-protein] reductase FabG-like isoform X2 n=1 Tax=Leptotrombidium deliense TaxID=299467 RepID=A0A443SIY2_9ACAR|nr:3-oxoacyl-[acyl-carrier-protein] reductase FabG-like isoform X2 [Leptotrombidium deliense]